MGLVAIGSSSGSDPIVSPSLTILSQSMSWGMVEYEQWRVWILNIVHYQVPFQIIKKDK